MAGIIEAKEGEARAPARGVECGRLGAKHVGAVTAKPDHAGLPAFDTAEGQATSIGVVE